MAFHAFILLPDPYSHFTLIELLVPFASTYRPIAVGLGAIVLYGSVIVTLSFYAKRWIGQRGWRALHYASFALFGGALVHGVTSGTDSARPGRRSCTWPSASPCCSSHSSGSWPRGTRRARGRRHHARARCLWGKRARRTDARPARRRVTSPPAPLRPVERRAGRMGVRGWQWPSDFDAVAAAEFGDVRSTTARRSCVAITWTDPPRAGLGPRRWATVAGHLSKCGAHRRKGREAAAESASERTESRPCRLLRSLTPPARVAPPRLRGALRAPTLRRCRFRGGS